MKGLSDPFYLVRVADHGGFSAAGRAVEERRANMPVALSI